MDAILPITIGFIIYAFAILICEFFERRKIQIRINEVDAMFHKVLITRIVELEKKKKRKNR